MIIWSSTCGYWSSLIYKFSEFHQRYSRQKTYLTSTAHLYKDRVSGPKVTSRLTESAVPPWSRSSCCPLTRNDPDIRKCTLQQNTTNHNLLWHIKQQLMKFRRFSNNWQYLHSYHCMHTVCLWAMKIFFQRWLWWNVCRKTIWKLWLWRIISISSMSRHR